MGIFDKKKHYSLAEVFRGLQHAVNSANEMLQAHQLNSLGKFWDNDKPVSKTIEIDGKKVSVPLISLISQNHMVMDDVEIKLNARVGDVMTSAENGIANGPEMTMADLQMALEGVKATDNDVMQITLRFKTQQPTEGVARLTDQFNKNL